MEALILEAIKNKRMIEFIYRNLVRVGEPHVYGVTNGVKQVLVYQTGGRSSNGGLPDWRRFDLAQMSRIGTLAQTFPGRRYIPSGKHSSWDLRIAIVD
ncbi:WYL domain-containing protein [Burkholderia orbicola]